MLKFLGFVTVYDLEVLLVHGHKVYTPYVKEYQFKWGESYSVTYAFNRHTRSHYPVNSVVAVNVKTRLTHKFILWWKEGS